MGSGLHCRGNRRHAHSHIRIGRVDLQKNLFNTGQHSDIKLLMAMKKAALPGRLFCIRYKELFPSLVFILAEKLPCKKRVIGGQLIDAQIEE